MLNQLIANEGVVRHEICCVEVCHCLFPQLNHAQLDHAVVFATFAISGLHGPMLVHTD